MTTAQTFGVVLVVCAGHIVLAVLAVLIYQVIGRGDRATRFRQGRSRNRRRRVWDIRWP